MKFDKITLNEQEQFMEEEEALKIHYEFEGVYIPVDIPFKDIYYSQFPRASVYY